MLIEAYRHSHWRYFNEETWNVDRFHTHTHADKEFTEIGDGLIDGIVKMNMYENEAAKELDQFIQK